MVRKFGQSPLKSEIWLIWISQVVVILFCLRHVWAKTIWFRTRSSHSVYSFRQRHREIQPWARKWLLLRWILTIRHKLFHLFFRRCLHLHLVKKPLQIFFFIRVLLYWNLWRFQDEVIWTVFVLLRVVIEFTCLGLSRLFFGTGFPGAVVLFTLRLRNSPYTLHLFLHFFKIDRAWILATQHTLRHRSRFLRNNILSTLINMIHSLIFIQKLIAHKTLYFARNWDRILR